MNSPTTAVLVEDLSVDLGTGPILDGIDLQVPDGRALALLGANGSGKTTLVKALIGLVPPASGRVSLYGTEVSARRAVPWSRIGYVPQRVNTSPPMAATAEEVVLSGLLTGRRLRPGPGSRGRVRDALAEVGLADRAGESVHLFSGGQQQRVLIARALIRKPDLLIIDEPLSGIDRASKLALAASLQRLRSAGTTIIVVLHELAELGPLIDRAVTLDQGRVIQDGAPPSAPSDDPGHHHPDTLQGAFIHRHPVPDLRARWRL
ncbi:metal ABC transporter ATP-binding protein [Arthrobacter pityocampae]|uniref:metal ABC transporter ATP-binding protein n=1 Tax=Arthrobacter pityocampae TaxID=547334 RepID=UPI001F4D472C|nr:metal ABC transporter ATP-binding protein [Arthrobacter pityocampae]